MNAERFDAVTKFLTTRASRRRGLRLLAGAAITAWAGGTLSVRASSGCIPNCDCDHVQAGLLTDAYQRQCRQVEQRLRQRLADGVLRIVVRGDGTISGGDLCDSVASGEHAWPVMDGPAECGGRCPEGLTTCGTGCFNLQTNAAHCGSCGESCGAGQRCVSGQCDAIPRGGSDSGEPQTVEIIGATPEAGDAEEESVFRGGPNLPGVVPGPGPSGTPKMRWQQAIGDGSFSAPAVVDGAVYAGGADGNLRAFDAVTGDERWSFPTGGAILGTPAVVGGIAVAGSGDGVIYARDVNDGREVWTVTTNGPVTASPTVTGGIAYIGGFDRVVRAIDVASGASRWSAEVDNPVIAAAAVSGDTVVAVTIDVDQDTLESGYVGSCYALDLASGRPRWVVRLAAFAAPAVVGGSVYLDDADGVLHALDLATGEERWTVSINGSSDGLPAAEPHSAPACDGKTVYVGGIDGSVYALAVADGSERWRLDTGNPVFASPTVAGGTVYVAGGDGNLYALDAATGAEQWRWAAGSVDSAPVVLDGTVYLTAFDGTLSALGA